MGKQKEAVFNGTGNGRPQDKLMQGQRWRQGIKGLTVKGDKSPRATDSIRYGAAKDGRKWMDQNKARLRSLRTKELDGEKGVCL